MACDSGVSHNSVKSSFVSVKHTLYFSGIKHVSASNKPPSGCIQEDKKIKLYNFDFISLYTA